MEEWVLQKQQRSKRERGVGKIALTWSSSLSLSAVKTATASVKRALTSRNSQITLSRLEWVEFIRLCDPVTAYMWGETQQSRKEEEISWSLATENSSGVEMWTTVSTKIRLFYVERTPYCSITVYEGSTPSDQGVTLDRSEWEQVRISTARSSSFNVYLAVQVYRALLKDAIMRALPEHCDDCKWNRINVMNHECHVDKNRLIHQVAKELADTAVPPCDFSTNCQTWQTVVTKSLNSAPRIFTTCVTTCSDPGA